MKTATKYSEELRENKPIVWRGLRFQPLAVKHFALYQNAKAAMEIMQASLPVRFARMSWIECLEAMDREAEKDVGLSTGYFLSILQILDVALGTDAIRNPTALQIARNRDGGFAALVVQKGGGNPVAIGPTDMNELREILAAQNGYEIPDENWNPELVRAQQYLREQRSTGSSGFSLKEAVYSVAAATGNRAGEIWNWPIVEFLEMQSAVDRRLRFQICSAAELGGQIKFTGGNPYPTWIHNSKSSLPTGFVSLKELEDGAKGLLKQTNDN